jgi:hypothetical protein
MSLFFRFFLWRETTAAQRAAFQAQFGEHPYFPAELSPFVREDRIEPLNSVGLTCDDRLVGWMITERLSAQTILYARAFVIPELQRMGKYFLQLITEAGEYAYRQHIDQGAFTISATNTRMCQLLYKRLLPYVTEIREEYCASISTTAV